MSRQYSGNPYSASGTAGRWNPKGTSMIYAGSSPAVSQLEYLCIKGPIIGTQQWDMIEYEMSEEAIGSINAQHLPPDWNALPHGRTTQDFGRQWLALNLPFLKVPSARLDISFFPEHFNVLINPNYPALRETLRVNRTVPFKYLLG